MQCIDEGFLSTPKNCHLSRLFSSEDVFVSFQVTRTDKFAAQGLANSV